MIHEKILIDNAYFTQLKARLAAAQKTIDLEFYIFDLDSVGKSIIAILAAAVKRGVTVRLLIDGIGSHEWDTATIDQVRKAGIRLRIFHPLPWRFWQWRHGKKFQSIVEKIFYLSRFLNSRTHRKYCIIDEKIAFVGSANISGNKKTDNHNIAWHNITAEIHHDKLDNLQYAFNKAWGGIKFKHDVKFFFEKINVNPLFRLNYTYRLRRKLYKDLLMRLRNAKKHIWITAAYFVPKTSLIKQLIKAANAGIDVTLVMPRHSDVAGMKLLIRTYYPLLLKAGIKIYEYKKGLLHTKLLIIDDWYCLGSSNLNYRSFYYDLEVDVNISTPSAQKVLNKQFVEYCADAEAISLDTLKHVSLLDQYFSKLLLMIKYWF